jgi:hypothetical protein
MVGTDGRQVETALVTFVGLEKEIEELSLLPQRNGNI